MRALGGRAWPVLAALALFSAFGLGVASGESQSSAPSGAFNFYVLSLSWSPSYCATEGRRADRQQCGRTARPYSFIVHGLWPQEEEGYTRNCPTSLPRVDSGIARSVLDIMPSTGLIRHQWRAHGACTGLSQEDYFRAVRAAWEQVRIPAEFHRIRSHRVVSPGEVEAAFLRANPGLPASGVAVTCDRRYLRDVRICMTKDLRFRSCPRVDRQACRRPSVLMPAVRGG